MGYIAGIQTPDFDPGAALQNTIKGLSALPQQIGDAASAVNQFTGNNLYHNYGGQTGAVKVGGATLWAPGKRDAYIDQQLKAQGITDIADQQKAKVGLQGENDPDKINRLIGQASTATQQQKQKVTEAKQEAQSIDQKLFNRQTGLMDRSFGYQKDLTQLQGQQGLNLANVNAQNQVKLAGINAQNALQLADKQTRGQLAIQGLQNQGQYKISDLTSGRQLQASKMQAIANLLTPAGSSFKGLGNRTLQ
jgi:hypothetical protein